jgi:hypothetical protein
MYKKRERNARFELRPQIVLLCFQKSKERDRTRRRSDSSLSSSSAYYEAQTKQTCKGLLTRRYTKIRTKKRGNSSGMYRSPNIFLECQIYEFQIDFATFVHRRIDTKISDVDLGRTRQWHYPSPTTVFKWRVMRYTVLCMQLHVELEYSYRSNQIHMHNSLGNR